MLNLVELREIAGQAYEAFHKHLGAHSGASDGRDEPPVWSDVDRTTRNAWVLAVVEIIERSGERLDQRGDRQRIGPGDRASAEEREPASA